MAKMPKSALFLLKKKCPAKSIKGQASYSWTLVWNSEGYGPPPFDSFSFLFFHVLLHVVAYKKALGHFWINQANKQLVHVDLQGIGCSFSLKGF